MLAATYHVRSYMSSPLWRAATQSPLTRLYPALPRLATHTLSKLRSVCLAIRS
jgi:hypothetical protein